MATRDGTDSHLEDSSAAKTVADADWTAKVLERAGVGAFVVDHVSQKIVRANEPCARMLGTASAKDLEGSSILLLYSDPKERAEIAARLLANEQFRRTGLARVHVRRIRRDSKNPVELSIALAASFDPQGTIQTMDCVMHEVGDGRVDERAFRLSEERFRVLFEANHAAMALTDLEGHLTRTNRAFCTFIGREERDLVGRDLLELFHPDDRPERPVPPPGESGFELGERRFVRAEGNVSWGVVTGSWLSDRPTGDAEIHSAVLVIQDVTEKKAVEQSLQRIARLEALGQLAGGIAHDFNNVLAVVIASLQLANRQTDLTDSTRDMIRDGERAAKRAAGLARQLVTFARGGAPSKRIGSLSPIAREAAEFGTRGSNARVELDLVDDLWPCDFDPEQMNQVFHNLVINAAQAMPSGGIVRVAARNVTVNPGDPTPLPRGRYVCVTVQDDGIGIDPRHIDRIFDPYFTTKRTGSGLGLATAHSIVAKHGGVLTAENAPERGSVFRTFLPATDASATDEPAIEAVATPRLDGRVLVMDDEDDVRNTLIRALEAGGLQAVGVADQPSTIAAYGAARAAGRPFDAVILDLTIAGGEGGAETLVRLREIDPSVRAVVISGYAASRVISNWREFGFAAAVLKPFGTDELLGAVAKALSGSAGAAGSERAAARDRTIGSK